MFCGRSRMPSVRIVKSATTAISAMKMPFLPRSASTCVSQLVNRFSVGLMFAPTAVLLLSDMCVFSWRASARLLHGHELQDGFGCGLFDRQLAGDAPFGERVHPVGDAEEL